ncbi:MAG: carbohydrate binding family 9 domain-containing protein [Candidatus Aminicenantes bacterium]|nr:carbohydrate binding family 9 domain-containing protein [Candidatus Aminicenantes bacterium]
MNLKKIFIILLAVLLPLPAAANTKTEQIKFHTMAENVDLPHITAVPKIDGLFEKDIYKNFVLYDNFFQMIPKYNTPASEKTQVFLAFDDENLYFAFKAFYRNPKIIRTSISRRDKFENNDFIRIIIDPFVTRIKGMLFSVNPNGIQKDAIYDEMPGSERFDWTWDALFYSAGKIYDWGYFVEIKIPFKSLRFPAGKKIQKWGIHLMRWIAHKSEYDSLFFIDRTKRGWLNQQPMLVISKNIKPGLHVEVVPSVTTLVNKGEDAEYNAGASFKYNISSDTTLDFTYNPDFSHIEADAGQININQRYALYYEEKRPFFLESKEIFKTPIEVFYSRRIATPRFGGKITGRSGRSTFGLVSGYDTGSFMNLSNVPAGGEEKAWNNSFRYKYEFTRENSIGMFVTDKRWQGDNYNTVFGLDSHIKHKGFMGDFQALLSKTRFGDKTEGQAYYGLLSYENEHIHGNFLTEHYSPRFDAQIGFIQRTDMRRYRGYLDYIFLPEKKHFVNGGPSIAYDYITDWSGEVMDKHLSLGFQFQTYRFTNIKAVYNRYYEKFYGVGFDKNYLEFLITSSPLKFLTFGTYAMIGDGIFYSPNPFLGYNRLVAFWSTLLPTQRFAISADLTSNYFYFEKGGNLMYKMNIYRLKAVYYFTRNLSLRTIWEYNNFYDKHYGNVLLSYEYNPGTVFYLGYSTDRIYNAGMLEDTTYSIFLKISYLFRK